MDKSKVIEALGNWIIRITNEKTITTPEEVTALPEVAKVFLENINCL